MQNLPEQPPDEQPSERPEVRLSGELLAGRHAGDRRLRVRRHAEPQEIRLPAPVTPRRVLRPAVVSILGFAGFILAGTVMLTLPMANAAGEWTPLLVALFTATSAVCVTGLVVVDTATYWSGFGQVVILLLIQLGGLGFMTSSTLLLLLVGQRLALRQRVRLLETFGGGAIGSILDLIRRVILFTIIAEVLGAVILTARFLFEVEPPHAVWWGVFHAVSAFNNAGFDVIGDFRSLVPFNRDPIILLTVATLIVLGGISYTAVEELVRERRFVRLSLDTKLVLVTTVGLLVSGTVALLLTERSNPNTLGSMDVANRLLNAFFQSVAPRTAGFNSVPINQMTEPGQLVLIALMFVGGAAGSTAGGIKVQTFSLLLFAIISAARGLGEVVAFERRVATAQLLRVIAVALLSVALVFLVSFLLTVTEPFNFLPLLLETVSAFGTVGLTTGITPQISDNGRVILVLTMFAGRLGPLTLMLALAARERPARYRYPEEMVKIG